MLLVESKGSKGPEVLQQRKMMWDRLKYKAGQWGAGSVLSLGAQLREVARAQRRLQRAEALHDFRLGQLRVAVLVERRRVVGHVAQHDRSRCRWRRPSQSWSRRWQKGGN